MNRRNFFWLSNSSYEFFLGHSMNIFLGLIGVHEFFSFNFPLREYFFVLRTPPPPHKFSNGPSLNTTSPMTLVLYIPWVHRWLMRPIGARKCLCHIPDRISYFRKHKSKDPTKKPQATQANSYLRTQLRWRSIATS